MSRIIEPWRGKTLLKTIHGSKLYGLDHAGSDDDIYIVTERGPARQKMSTTDGVTTDIFVIGLDEYLAKVHKGTHQALEALYSDVAVIQPQWVAYFRGIRAYSPLVDETYDRTIRHLAASDEFKKRRHACRLALNLMDLRAYGRFNPTLTQGQIELVNKLALGSDNLLEGIQDHMVYSRVRAERRTQ